jgi:serine/threonine protein kinase
MRTPEVTFRVEENLGYGGVGEAHRVTNRMLNDDQIVIKVMHAEFARDPVAREKFAWEARVGRLIKHENLARVEWLGHLDDELKTPYFTMEYVKGKTLRDILRAVKGGKLDVEQALTIIAQILRGLGALHERGIIHQDIKPSNIMLCSGAQGDVVKLIDLGARGVRASRCCCSSPRSRSNSPRSPRRTRVAVATAPRVRRLSWAPSILGLQARPPAHALEASEASVAVAGAEAEARGVSRWASCTKALRRALTARRRRRPSSSGA